MRRYEFAPGAFVTEVPSVSEPHGGEKFKRCKVSVHLVVPGTRESATALALLPHVLCRRCAAVPDPTRLSRMLFGLYGAELASESTTAGASRVVTLGVGGLKNAYALSGEDLAAQYLELCCNLLFEPKLAAGAFEPEDVAIEKEKQAEYLKSELNDKRGYCLRQARRKLYGDSPLGLEAPGYLEDIPAITAQSLHAAYRTLLREARVEVMVCGIPAAQAAEAVAARLAAFERAPVPLASAPPLPLPAEYRHYSEPLQTVQGKLCVLLTSGHTATARDDAVLRVASALYGGLPTSRLFLNVREKQSLCYYCSSSFGFFGGTLTVDSGVDHDKAKLASAAILSELEALQTAEATESELDAARRYLQSAFATAKDSPDALLNWEFTNLLKGTVRSIDEMNAEVATVTAAEVREALARFAPAVEYVITGKEASR